MSNPLERPKQTPDTEREPAPFTVQSASPAAVEPPLQSGVREKIAKSPAQRSEAVMKRMPTPSIEITAPKPKDEKIPKHRPPYTASVMYPEESGKERAA